MAKKKHAKAAKRESPVRESNSMGWIIAAIVVVVIIAFLVMKGGTPTKTAEKETAPVAKGEVTASAAPPMDKKCTIAIGVVPGTKKVDGNNVAITFKNNGRTAMEGSYFEFSDGTKSVYRKNTDTVAPGATITFKVDLGQVASELGINIRKYVVYPVQGGKACENQRNVVIDYT